MAEIRPFKGILYHPDKSCDPARLVAPPYDVISDKMQDDYYNLDSHNVIRLILGKVYPEDTGSDNRYTRAKRCLDDWMKSGVLKQDTAPSIYIYEQRYLFKEKLKSRIGFISLLKIEDPHESRVLPHEYTLPKPKKDRFELLKATKTNMSPIFSLFEDNDSAISTILAGHIDGRPLLDIELDGVTHKIWRLSDAEDINKMRMLMEKKQIFIADGHHRYEVALSYRDRCRERDGKKNGARPYDYLMVYFSSLNPEALTVLSTHRVIGGIGEDDFDKMDTKLRKYFDIKAMPDRDYMFAALENIGEGTFRFGMYLKDKGFYILTLKDKTAIDGIVSQEKEYEWKYLDVTVLHQLIFNRILKIKESVDKRENIVYTRDTNYALELVDSGDYQAAFFQNPPRVDQIRDVASSRERMPRKTTYFYPKPLSGLVFYKHK